MRFKGGVRANSRRVKAIEAEISRDLRRRLGRKLTYMEGLQVRSLAAAEFSRQRVERELMAGGEGSGDRYERRAFTLRSLISTLLPAPGTGQPNVLEIWQARFKKWMKPVDELETNPMPGHSESRPLDIPSEPIIAGETVEEIRVRVSSHPAPLNPPPVDPLPDPPSEDPPGWREMDVSELQQLHERRSRRRELDQLHSQDRKPWD